MNSAHKATNQKFRDGYDLIVFNKSERTKDAHKDESERDKESFNSTKSS
jgi:hypothetical protein